MGKNMRHRLSQIPNGKVTVQLLQVSLVVSLTSYPNVCCLIHHESHLQIFQILTIHFFAVLNSTSYSGLLL